MSVIEIENLKHENITASIISMLHILKKAQILLKSHIPSEDEAERECISPYFNEITDAEEYMDRLIYSLSYAAGALIGSDLIEIDHSEIIIPKSKSNDEQ